MPRTRNVLAAIPLCAALVTPTQAHFVNGNTLVTQMEEWRKAMKSSASTNIVSASSYSAFVSGIHDILEYNNVVCTNTNTTARQVYSVVANYLDNHPQHWDEPAHALVTEALLTTFPCSN